MELHAVGRKVWMVKHGNGAGAVSVRHVSACQAWTVPADVMV